MTRSNAQLIRDFFAALSRGDLSDEMFTADATIWTNTSGAAEKAKYLGGVKLLQSLFDGALSYSVDSLIAEEDRVAAEARGRGKLKNGEEYHNHYVFIFRVRDGRIAAIAEYTNPSIVREKIMPLFQAAASR